MTRDQTPTAYTTGRLVRHSTGESIWRPDDDQADALTLDLAMQEITRLRHALWLASIDRVRLPLHPELAELYQLRQTVKIVHEYATSQLGYPLAEGEALTRIAQITKRPPASR